MFVVLLVAVGSVGSPVSTQSRSGPERAPNAGREPVNAEEYDRMFRQISNWGRWGKADELGSANLVTADTRRRAASLVRSGISVSLAHNFITEPAEDAPPASPPIRHIMTPPAIQLGHLHVRVPRADTGSRTAGRNRGKASSVGVHDHVCPPSGDARDRRTD
jgi:hypothetical protein